MFELFQKTFAINRISEYGILKLDKVKKYFIFCDNGSGQPHIFEKLYL